MQDIAKRAKDFVGPLRVLSYEEKKKYVGRVLIDLIDTYPDNEGLYRFVYAVQKELLGSFAERVANRLGNEQLNRQLITYFFAFFMLLYPGITNPRHIGSWIAEKKIYTDRRDEERYGE